MKYFNCCPQCSIYLNNVENWIRHLVHRHPLPDKWMSDGATNLTGEDILKPYTAVTESRKKRKKPYPPRPLNSFMIFSRYVRRSVLIFFEEVSNTEISKLLGRHWDCISLYLKSLYDMEARKLFLLHSKEYPNYKFRPKKLDPLRINLANSAPLQSYSWNRAAHNISFSTSNGIPQSTNSAPSASEYKNVPENVSNGFVGRKTNPFHFMENNIYKQSTKPIVTSNLMLEDSGDASSSLLSFKNTIYYSETPNCSPMIINESCRILSDLSNVIRSTNNNNGQIPLYSLTMEDKVKQGDIICHKVSLKDNIKPKSFNTTTPLTASTEEADFQSSKIVMRFVKMVDSKDLVNIYNNSMKTTTTRDGCKRILISQPSDIDDQNNPSTNKLLSVPSFSPDSDGIDDGNVSTFLNNDNEVDFLQDSSLDLEFNYDLDPLINENMFKDLEDNDGPFNLQTTDGSNLDDVSGSLNTPNFKFCSDVSNGSEPFGSPYPPFQLSEKENNAPQTDQSFPWFGVQLF